MKKVSIIVPVYNVQRYLKKSIKSLLAQTLDDIEIILVNDGSSDESNKIIEHYQNKFPEKIKSITISNSGAAHARNVGLSLASGEYIGFMDSDDYVDKTMYEKLYSLAIQDNAEITTCGYYRIDYSNIQKRDYVQRSCFGKSVYQAPDLFVYNVPYIWNKLFKRSLIEKTNIKFEEDLRIFEDLVFTYKLFSQANRISRVSEPLYNYIFSRDNSLTFTFSEKRFDLFKAFDSLINYFKEEGCYYHFEEELLFILTNHIYVVCGGQVEFSKIGLLYKFINKSFDYMDHNFPFWKDYTKYYSLYKKNKFLYTKKTYWRLRAFLPASWRRLTRYVKNFKHSMPLNKGGYYYYHACKKLDVNNKRILINSQHGNNICGNMFYILKELCNNPIYKDYEIGITYQKGNKRLFELMNEYGFTNSKIQYLINNSKEYTHFLATAKYLFNDTSFPVYFSKRNEQIYLNTWHGTPLKTLGRSTAEDYYDIANLQKNFLEADYLLYPSDYMIDNMLEDYMLSDIASNKILKCGYPRNEIFFDKNRELEIKEQFELDNKQIIAYMPTWRGNVRKINSQKDDIILYLQEIDKKLNDNQHMYVNLHPYVANQWKDGGYKHISLFPKNVETYDFLNCCDVLVTDYSSVFFDFAISKKKIVLFAYDEIEYFKNRGVYMPFSELPFTKVITVDELISEINNPHQINIHPFLEKYCKYESKDISKKICEMIILGKKNDLIEIDLNPKDKKMMISVNDFRNVLTVDKIEKTLKENPKTNSCLYLTYETKELRDKLILKGLSRNYSYLGTLNSYSLNPIIDSILLTFMENNSWIYKIFKKRIDKAIKREYQRAYPNVEFTQWTIYGYETFKTYLMALNECQYSILYISRKQEFNKKIPISIYKKFDYVIFKSEIVKNKCKYNEDNARVLKISTLEQLWIDELKQTFK